MTELPSLIFFFFNDTATTEIYTLSLHDALPISRTQPFELAGEDDGFGGAVGVHQQDPTIRRCQRALDDRDDRGDPAAARKGRSEEHTSELQSQSNLVCRLLLEKKKNLLLQPTFI